jgi:hypothetical protein
LYPSQTFAINMQIKTAIFFAIAIGCASAEISPPSPWSGQWSGTELGFGDPPPRKAVNATFNGDGTAKYSSGPRIWNASKLLDDHNFVGTSDDTAGSAVECSGAVHCAFGSTIIQMVCVFHCGPGAGGDYWVTLDRN